MKNFDAPTALVNELFESWAPCLYRYAYRLCCSAELADDFVQDAFLALYRELCSGQNVESPKAWTLSVVRHELANWRRSNRRHPEELTPNEEFDLIPVQQEDPWSEGPGIDDINVLLAHLTPREEEVVLLRMQSLKYREIASQIGISSKTVATLLARALKKMRLAVVGTTLREEDKSRCSQTSPDIT